MIRSAWNSRCFRLFLLTLAASAAAFAQSPGPSDLRGIYTIWGDVSSLPAGKVKTLKQSLYVPGVSGFVLDIAWSNVEPSRGVFDWTTFDSWLLPAVAAGKRIDVGVLSGNSSPAWLFAAQPTGAGAKQLSFVWSEQGGAKGNCTPITMAPPWDVNFLAEWDTMLGALSAHLKAVGAYGSVQLVRLTGVNTNTDELKLPVTTPAATGLTCVTDAIAIWQAAGYRPSLLMSGWNSILASYVHYFSDKTLVLPILEANAVPPIDENGNLVTGSRQSDTLPEVQAALSRLPSLISLETFLLPGTPPGAMSLNIGQNLKGALAFQSNEWSQSAAACGGTVTAPLPCTSSQYLQLLEGGIYPSGKSNSLRGSFIEVFPPDAISFSDAVLTGYAETVPDAIPPIIPTSGAVIHLAKSTVLSPGSIGDIYGTGLPTNAASAPAGADLPLGLAGASVSVGGIAAPLFYAGPGVVVFQVPGAMATGPTNVTLSVNGVPSLPVAITVQSAAPDLFLYNTNRALAQNQDFSLNSTTNGASPGSFGIAYLTGSGPTAHTPADGAPAPSVAPFATETTPTTVTVGSSSVAAAFAGLSPGYTGLVQVNFQVPNLPPGDYPLTVSFGSAVSNSGLFTVKN